MKAKPRLPSFMENKIHRYPLKILETHLDTYGHVNNAVYLTLFEQARWDMITENGYGLKRIQETGLGPTILEIQIRFRKELRLRQEVVIETQLQSARKKIAVIQQKIVDSQGTVYCYADFTFGLFDIHARKLVNPTPEWIQALGLVQQR